MICSPNGTTAPYPNNPDSNSGASPKLLGMGGEVLEEDLLLPEVAWHAAGVIEQARFASQAQAVESGEDEENEGAEVAIERTSWRTRGVWESSW